MTRAFLRGFWAATLALLPAGGLGLLVGLAIASAPAPWNDSKLLDYASSVLLEALYVYLVYRAATRSCITEHRPYMAFCAGVFAFNLLLEAFVRLGPPGAQFGSAGDMIQLAIELATYPALLAALYAGRKSSSDG